VDSWLKTGMGRLLLVSCFIRVKAEADGIGLAAMSYDLHKELSDKYDGANNWGYRTVETLVCYFSFDYVN
jgi:hypothetical protein